MRKRSKKFLSLCLALVMCLGLVPTAALAADITITEIATAKYEQVGEASEGLIAVKLDGKWGFIDMTGKEVIPCKYDAASARTFFSEGLAAVSLNGKWGFIDRTGREVVSFRYSTAQNFSNGVAVVEESEGRILIDQTGRELTTRKYYQIKDFSEGLAAVKVGNNLYGKWGFIDMTGREVIPCIYEEVSDFSGGLAMVRSGSGCGIVDSTGREVVPCTLPYKAVGTFSEGVAVVGVHEDTGEIDVFGNVPVVKKKCGLIDATGKELAPCKYNSIGEFEGGIAFVTLDDAWGLIDTTGKELLLVPGKAPSFHEGLAEVRDEATGLYGYINKWNEAVIPFQYSSALNFSGGLAVIGVPNGKYLSDGTPLNYYGIIDKTGKEIVSPNKYTDIEYLSGRESSSNGLIGVEVNGKWGFVDTTGKEVVPCKYTFVGKFSEGVAAVTDRGSFHDYLWGYIDKTGKEIVPCEYPYYLVQNTPHFSNGIATFRDKNEKWGILALTVTGKAQENKQTISIDGKDIPFAMYSPDNGGTNYVRLVDLAVAMKGTAGQFNVGYDGRVLLTTDVAYTGAASTAPFHSAMEYTMLDEPTYVDSVAQNLEAIRFEYQNGGYTYYKLRDLGEALGFNVGWDNATQRIYIESDKPYDPNN